MLTFFLLCVISELSGFGIIKILRLRFERRYFLFLAPLVTLAFWALTLGIAVTFRIPVKHIYIPIWLITIGFAMVGVWGESFRELFQERILFVVVLLSTIAVTAAYFWYGYSIYLGSPALDGWSYIAFGQYLWEYPRCTEGGLAPLYQYAAHLCHTRFIASSLLGFFSPLNAQPGDTQASVGYLFSWAFFVYACAVAFFALNTRLKKWFQWLYVILVIFSGWSLAILAANNFDNVLVLGFFPALAGIILFIQSPILSWGGLLAILSSGVVYIYPEMAPLILSATCFYFLQRLCSSRSKKLLMRWLLLFLIAALLFFLLLAPAFNNMVSFFRNQLSSTSSLVRPGGDIGKELLNPISQYAAFWGMGGISRIQVKALLAIQLLTIVPFGLLIYGLFCLFRKREWGSLAAFFFLSVIFVYMIFFQRYGYGAYKIILLVWWLVIYAVLVGYSALRGRLMALSPFYRRAVGFFLTACLLVLITVISAGFYLFYSGLAEKNILSFKQVKTIRNLISTSPVMVSVSDTIANEWAMYYLRDTPIYLFPYRGYAGQSHVIPFMERAKPVNLSEIHYVLTDYQTILPEWQTTLLWSGDRYKLWRIESTDWVLLVDIQNSNGVENWSGRTGLWLGQKETVLSVIASKSSKAFLSAEFSPGPSLLEKTECQLALTTDKGYRSMVTISAAGPRLISLPLEAGRNQIVLTPINQPDLLTQPNEDNRIMLVGMRDPKIVLSEAFYSTLKERR